MTRINWRVFAGATLLALGLGISCAWLLVAVNEWPNVTQDPLGALFIAVLSPGPAVLLSAFVSGYLASSAVAAKQHWPLTKWVRQGFVGGGAVGGCALSAWFSAISLDPTVALLTLALGAIAGALTGSVVAVYCWRIARE